MCCGSAGGSADLGWAPSHTGDPRTVGWLRMALAGVAETPQLSSTCVSHLSSRLARVEGRSPKEGRLLQACFQASALVRTPDGLWLKQVCGHNQIQGWGNRLCLLSEKSHKVLGQRKEQNGASSSLLLLSV